MQKKTFLFGFVVFLGLSIYPLLKRHTRTNAWVSACATTRGCLRVYQRVGICVCDYAWVSAWAWAQYVGLCVGVCMRLRLCIDGCVCVRVRGCASACAPVGVCQRVRLCVGEVVRAVASVRGWLSKQRGALP